MFNAYPYSANHKVQQQTTLETYIIIVFWVCLFFVVVVVFFFFFFFKENKSCLADISHEMSRLIFSENRNKKKKK